MSPVSHRVSGTPGDIGGSVGGHHHPLGRIDLAAGHARTHHPEGRGSSLTSRHPPTLDLRGGDFLAGAEHVGKALDVGDPYPMHLDAEVGLDDVAGLDDPVAGMGVAPVRA